MIAPLSLRRVTTALALALGCLAGFVSCATTASTPRSGQAYRLTWTATRATDHSPLASSSLIVRLGGSASERTDSTHPTDDTPAFPSFFARLSPTRAAGVYELVVRAALRESHHNPKGKLKRTKRNIGALVPIRSGETQVVSSATDGVHLEVHLERE